MPILDTDSKMANFLGRFKALFRKKEVSILMVGLDAAGKTVILYKFKLGLEEPASTSFGGGKCGSTFTKPNCLDLT